MIEETSNAPCLARLGAAGLLRCGPLSALAPELPPLPAPPPRDRIEGMLLGLAIGDSLGNTSEGMRPAERRAAHGMIRDYLPNRHAGYRRVGLPSDDTQLSFWALESILAAGRVDPADLASRFAEGEVYGAGATFREFLAARRSGVGWERAGGESAGNGALMRCAPLLLPSLSPGGEELAADVAAGSLVTHNDSASLASCLAFGVMLRELLAAASPPPREWWAERFAGLAALVETPAAYSPREGRLAGLSGTLSAIVRATVPEALAAGTKVLDACEAWGSGAYLIETAPCVLLTLARCATDPEEAIARAVNDTKDNDTAAAIVGAAVGALHGARALPRRWVAGLSGRTRASDDGTVQRLAAEAAERYGA